MKFDQDLCLNLQYDFGKMNSTLGSIVPLAMFLIRGRSLLYAMFNETVVGIKLAEISKYQCRKEDI